MATSATYYLSALGDLRLTGPGGELLAGRRKELVLLTYLAMKGPRPVAREELAALLWGEREEAKARQSLRHALYQLRQADGRYQERSDWHREYSVKLAYDDIGNLATKDQQDGRYVPNGTGWRLDYLIRETTVGLKYTYGGPRPHAPTVNDPSL